MSSPCVQCKGKTKCTDSRIQDGIVRRRLECTKCKHRFTTIEYPVLGELRSGKRGNTAKAQGIQQLSKLPEAIEPLKLKLKEMLEFLEEYKG